MNDFLFLPSFKAVIIPGVCSSLLSFCPAPPSISQTLSWKGSPCSFTHLMLGCFPKENKQKRLGYSGDWPPEVPALCSDAPDHSEPSCSASHLHRPQLHLLGLHGIVPTPLWNNSPSCSHEAMQNLFFLRLNILHLSIIPHITKSRLSSPFWLLSPVHIHMWMMLHPHRYGIKMKCNSRSGITTQNKTASFLNFCKNKHVHSAWTQINPF